MLLTKSHGVNQESDDLFESTPEWGDSETDSGSDLLERWLRLAEAALKNRDEKDEAEKDKQVTR